MGFGSFVGAATKAYNEADAENFRRSRIAAQQAQDDARFGREQKGWAQEDASEAAVKQGGIDASDALNNKGGAQLTPEMVDGMGLPADVVNNVKGLIASGGDAYGAIKAARASSIYTPAVVGAGLDPSKVILPAAASPDASAIENRKLLANTQATGMAPAGSQFVGSAADAANPATAKVGYSPQDWDNMRSYQGSDGQTYMTTTAKRGASQSEMNIMAGRRLAALGDVKSQMLGAALSKQGYESHSTELNYEIDKASKDTSVPFAERMANMAGIMTGSAVVPGQATVVGGKDGQYTLQYSAPGQKEPILIPLKGSDQASQMGDLRVQLAAMNDPKMHMEMARNNAEIAHSTAATTGLNINNGLAAKYGDANAKASLAQSAASTAASYGGLRASNAATNASVWSLSQAKDQAEAVDAAQKEYAAFDVAAKKDPRLDTPEARNTMIRKLTVSISNNSQEFRNAIAPLSKPIPDLSPMQKMQMDSMQDFTKASLVAGEFNPIVGKTAADSATVDQRTRSATTQNLARAGIRPDNPLYAMFLPDAGSDKAAEAAVVAQNKQATGAGTGTGLPAMGNGAGIPPVAMGGGLPTTGSRYNDPEQDPIVQNFSKLMAQASAGMATDQTQIAKFTQLSEQKKQYIKGKYGV